jgi:[acyl-carrier-protein] S-malonyltransferase
MKTAFVFPGQGAQYIGMAQGYIAADATLAKTLKDFDQQHSTPLARAMAEGPEDLLKQTHLTQPAILFHSICALTHFQRRFDLVPDYVAGHSLGEFSALVASGILSLEDAMHLVHKRGEFMIRANEGTPFAMAAVIGLSADQVVELCTEASATALVQAVNFNTPIQTVISGTAQGVEIASELAKAKGAKRVLPLVVGGPFHTPLISRASTWLAEEMAGITFVDGKVPVVSNLDASPSISGAEARQKLERQIISPVRWVECVHHMIEAGVTRFVEFGPLKVLSGMIKNIDKDVSVYSIDLISDLDALQEVLG